MKRLVLLAGALLFGALLVSGPAMAQVQVTTPTITIDDRGEPLTDANVTSSGGFTASGGVAVPEVTPESALAAGFVDWDFYWFSNGNVGVGQHLG